MKKTDMEIKDKLPRCKRIPFTDNLGHSSSVCQDIRRSSTMTPTALGDHCPWHLEVKTDRTQVRTQHTI